MRNRNETAGGYGAKRSRRLSGLLALALLLSVFIGTSGFSAEAGSTGAEGRWRDITDVIAGEGFTVALRQDGQVLYAGNDFSGAGSRIAGWEHIERIEMQGWENYVIGYTESGGIRLESLRDWETIVGEPRWREEYFSGWTDIRQLWIESDIALALTSRGSVAARTLEKEYDGALREVCSWTEIRELATDGYSLIMGLKKDGTVVSAALSEYGLEQKMELERQGALRDVAELTVGYYGIYAIRRDGTVVGTGEQSDWKNVDSLYFAMDSMFALHRDGTVSTLWDEYYQEDPRIAEVVSWSNIVALGFDITGIARYIPVGLRADGTVCGVTSSIDGWAYGEWDFEGWTNVVKLYSGTDYTIGIRADGTVLVTGGEFGTLDYLDEIAPWTDVQAIYAASGEYEDHIVGLKKNGTLLAAGDNSMGQCNVAP